jgi:regulatory protein
VDFSEHKFRKTVLSPEAALLKIRNWCAYQERSQQETRKKLYDYGLAAEEVEQIITSLIEQNFLNEERFALALAGGKFRIKRWGRVKIKLELKKHGISDYSINKALLAINVDEYVGALKQVAEKKLATIKGQDRRKRFYTALSYLVSRGFESDLATEQLNQLLEKT